MRYAQLAEIATHFIVRGRHSNLVGTQAGRLHKREAEFADILLLEYDDLGYFGGP